jgi:DNA-binding response OmpR family regulator
MQDAGVPEMILVIEDDESLNLLIRRRLNRAGFPAEGASSGTEALRMIAAKSYRLLLLDYTLPDMSGSHFLGKLRDSKRSVPFIVASGQKEDAVVAEMMKLGARGYLEKDNAFLDSLLPMVSTALGRAAPGPVSAHDPGQEQADLREGV